MSAAAKWRSPLLGERVELDLPEGRLECFRRGSGPALVFAHGWLANANLWRRVVGELAGEFTCITLDLPLGAHRVPIPDAPLDPGGVGRLIAGAIEELDLGGVTLVGNDSGGAYSQVAIAHDGARVARLVLTNCETPFDDFPPEPFTGLPTAARNVGQLGTLLKALRDPEVRTLPAAFGLLAKHPLDPQRYAAELRGSRVVVIADAYSFVAEDQPVALARALLSRA